jgi:maltose-binding protein MalE
VLQGAAADFEAATGIPVDIQLVGFGDIRGQIQEAGPAGEGADIFIGAHDWVGELVANGILAPVDLPNPDDYYDIATGAFSIDGTLYGLPYAVEGMALFRNTDLVPDAPATFDDLLAACDGLGDAIDNCLGVPAGDAYANQAFVQGFGGYVFGYTETGFDPTDVGLDSEGAFEGADFLDAQVKAGILDPAIGWGESGDLFNQGLQAFMWNGPWQAGAVNDAGINWDSSPFPTIGDDNNPVPFVGVQAFMISAFSEQPVAAQTFVTEFVNSQELMFDFFVLGGRGPAHKGAYADALADSPWIAAFAPVEEDPIKAMPNIPEVSAMWGALGEAIATIYNQTYTDEVPDARAAFQRAADAVRNTIAEG